MSYDNIQNLTPNQLAVLVRAADANGGRIEEFPETVKGGARQTILKSLEKRGLVEFKDRSWFVTDAAIQALRVVGALADGPCEAAESEPARDASGEADAPTEEGEPERDDTDSSAEEQAAPDSDAEPAQAAHSEECEQDSLVAAEQEAEPEAKRPAPVPRAGTKQAQAIDLMKRPEGATNRQIQALTEWQPHTVRGFIAGTLRKKLQLTVQTTRDQAGDLVYRITE